MINELVLLISPYDFLLTSIKRNACLFLTIKLWLMEIKHISVLRNELTEQIDFRHRSSNPTQATKERKGTVTILPFLSVRYCIDTALITFIEINYNLLP